jgi:hypothetical protein
MTRQPRIPLVLALLPALTLVAACAGEPDSRRETVNGTIVVHLSGTPFQMGQQHARLLRDELRKGIEEIESNILLKAMFALAQTYKLDQLAQQRSLPEILEECQGMVAEMGAEGWTLERCLVLNFGDVVAEQIKTGTPAVEDLAPGCAQIVASGAATADARLYHARILDWSQIDYIINYPVIFVRRPQDGVPHVIVGFPGNLSPYQGINAEKIAVASNEVDALNNKVNDRTGVSHVQLVGRLLSRARSLDDVRTMIRDANHMSLETIVASDGETGVGAVFEMAPQAVETRELEEGAVFATNHFLGTRTAPLDADPASQSSLVRYQRLQQLVSKNGGAESLHGKLAPATLVQIMRDRKNPTTGAMSPATEFDDNKSLATNGALYQIVFDPAARRFWLAAGKIPIPAQPFVGFSLDQLLDGAGSSPDAIP